jgi:hypothetical protein
VAGPVLRRLQPAGVALDAKVILAPPCVFHQ